MSFFFKNARKQAKTNVTVKKTHRHKTLLSLEQLEDRNLLTVGAFLQGTAFIDQGNNHTLTSTDPYLSGATVSLYQGTTVSQSGFLASTTTNSTGAYLFKGTDDGTGGNVASSYGGTGLNPGVYTLVETPPSGYVSDGTQILSQLNPASAINANTIQVTLANPANLALNFNSTTFYNRNAWDYLQENLQFTGAGVTHQSAVVTLTNTNPLSVGQSVTVTDGTTTLLSTIASISSNTSITLANNWTGPTESIAAVTATTAGTSGQFPVIPYAIQSTNAGATTGSPIISVSNASSYSVGEAVSITNGTTEVDTAVKSTAANTITLNNNWTGTTTSVTVLTKLVNSGVTYPFLTYCWDLGHSLDNGSNIYQVTPTPGIGTPANAGQIAYLFNHYATVDMTTLTGTNPTTGLQQGTTAQAVGLQIAIWQLEYGTTFKSFSLFANYGSDNVANEANDIQTWANYYTTISAGKSETATFLQVTGSSLQGGLQGMIATGSLDFSNFGSPAISTSQQPATATIGTPIADQATVSGGYTPTGTVTFNLYNNSNGTGTPLFTDTETLSGGVATSVGYIATATGTDYWVATYNGDSNNGAVTSGTALEPVVVSPASPAINTTQQPASAIVGSSIADKATVSGGYNPTGTVTFNLYSNSTGTGTSLFTDTETLSGGSATSKGYLATGTGTDYWVATYNGDSNNSAVTSGTALEPVVISAATPAINTSQQPATATVGSSIADKATVSGGYNPTGTVTFKLYSNSNGTGTSLFTDTETLSGGTATSAGYIATGTGTDYWVATYNGDSNNSVVTSGTALEPVSITTASPAINTSQQPATATVGTSIADKATVSGGYNPTGTVTFTLYTNPNGTGTPLYTDANVPLSGGIATSVGYIATATGTDYWVATYNGDSNNSAVTSGTALEPVIVSLATPAITTTQQPASATVGTSIADKATVSGGYNPTGTVTFTLYSNPNGSGSPLFTDTETLSGGTATSAGYIATATATDYWVATYNGDSNNNAVTSGTALEPVSITIASPAINTSQQPANAIVGSSIADKATVSGGYNPTGTVTFNLYSNSAGTGTSLFTDTETLSGGTATSKGYNATATATDYWVATYNGDSNNSAVTSGTALEPVNITIASPAINTTQQPASATIGSSIADKATVSGGYNPTGTVTFTLYSNPNGSGSPLFTNTETLSGGTATSAGYIATATGTDYWVATYNGDSNNSAVTSGTALEPVIVSPASPLINTSQQPASATVGTSIADKATVSGGYYPTGTVTFTLYNNSTGTGTPLYTDANVPLSGGIATSVGYIATATGTDYWVATYNGDSNNSAVTSGTALEPVVVSPASPAINTSQQPASATVGTSIADKATVSGGYNPTGTVTFNLYSNSAGTGTSLFTDTETLSGGTATSKGYIATATRTDYWVATYNGDSNNSAVTSGTALEPVSITIASPAINTSQQPASAAIGSSIADQATVSGGYNPTGTVTFKLYNNSNGTGTPLFTDTETLSGSTATSKGYIATALVTDYWVATYNGDSNNNAVTSGTALEPVVVSPALPTIVTTASSAVTLGTTAPTLSDSAVLSGGYNETGKLVFTLTGPGGFSYTQKDTLTGNGTYKASTTLPTTGIVAGTYTWVVTYAGDVNNNSATDQDSSLAAFNAALPTQATEVPTYPSTTSYWSSKVSNGGALNGTYQDWCVDTTDYMSSGQSYSVAVYSSAGAAIPLGVVANPQNLPLVNWIINQSFVNTKASDGKSYTEGDVQDAIWTVLGLSVSSYEASTLGTYTASHVSAIVNQAQAWGTNFVPQAGQSVAVILQPVNASGVTDGQVTVIVVPVPSNEIGTAEQTVVSPASPTVVTTASGNISLSNCTQTITDSAVLSGGYLADGLSSSITFTLTLNGTAVSAATQTDTVTKNGTYTSSYTLPSTDLVGGTYAWHAQYSGDANNKAASDQGGSAEQTIVTGATISGIKYLDLTGNGFSSDDTGLSGVTINLYQGSTPGLSPVASTTTAADGTYSFSGLRPGMYSVVEVVPSGYVQTGGGPNGTAGTAYYTISSAQSGSSYGSNNFDDYLIPTCTPTGVCFSVYDHGTYTWVTNLGGATHPGDTVTVYFQVTGTMSDTLSLVSYVAPSSGFDSSIAWEQVIYQVASGTFAPSSTFYSLTVVVPTSAYQIDFVCGKVINTLAPLTYNGASYGPDAANVLYTPQGRLITSDNEAGTVANWANVSYWYNNNNGKNVNNLSSGLGSWLANIDPTLSSWYSIVEGSSQSLSTASNNAVFSFYSTLANPNNAWEYHTDDQVLAYFFSLYQYDSSL